HMVGTPFAVFIASTLVIVSVFAAVAASTRRPHTVDYVKATRLRVVTFATLGAVLLLFLTLTLPHLPYAVDAQSPDPIVHAARRRRPRRGKAVRVVADIGCGTDARERGHQLLADRDGARRRADRVSRDDARREPRVQSVRAGRRARRANAGDARLHESPACDI